jgi:hypothetical protein
MPRLHRTRAGRDGKRRREAPRAVLGPTQVRRPIRRRPRRRRGTTPHDGNTESHDQPRTRSPNHVSPPPVAADHHGTTLHQFNKAPACRLPRQMPVRTSRRLARQWTTQAFRHLPPPSGRSSQRTTASSTPPPIDQTIDVAVPIPGPARRPPQRRDPRTRSPKHRSPHSRWWFPVLPGNQ